MKRLIALSLALLLSFAARADVPTLLQLVDYLGVDYPGAVANGQVLSASEFAEMQEFAGRIQSEITQLPATGASEKLQSMSQQLLEAVSAKAAPAAIAGLTQSMRELLMGNYNIVLTPRAKPDLVKGGQLFAQNCAACHGDSGHGDGPAGAVLQPKPTDFHDGERARQRSLFALYNTITLGIAGTPMTPHPELSDMDRWDIAFFVGGFSFDAVSLAQGEQAWQHTPLSLVDAVTQTPAQLAIAHQEGESLAAWSRLHPELLFAGNSNPLQIAREHLSQSLQAYRNGEIRMAQDAAVTGYLEGFELIEAPLGNVDAVLMKNTEAAMMAFRNSISKRESAAQVKQRYDEVLSLLDQSEKTLAAGELSPSVAFSGSLVILLREGLEIILVLAAIITFLAKAGRKDALVYVHAGWALALVAGVGTWAVSAYIFTISGATREMTEGITALIASAILLYVGFWMHRNASAQRWNVFLKSQIQAALDQRTLWTLALVSFLAVYREIFEIILFYEALWAQVANNAHIAVFSGAGFAFLLLMLITWLIYRFGMRLPLKLFFTTSAIVMIVLAFIFTGKGIAALQEAGVVNTYTIPFPTIELLGIYPNMLALALQLVVVVLALAVFLHDRKSPH